MAIDDNLYAGENVLSRLHPSAWNYFWVYLIGVVLILTLACSPIGILVLIWAYMDSHATTYLITDRRLMREVGIMGKATSSTIYQKITDIHSSQSAIQSMLGIGDISINTAGGEGPEINIRGIGDMPSIKKEIEQAWAGGAKA